jgi:copper transport protein
MWRRVVVVLGTILIGVMGVSLVSAHSTPLRSDPSPNAILDTAPTKIEMWFSEPMEADFSAIRLRDKDGNVLDTPPSAVDPNDPTHITLAPGDLSDGLYTVAWRSVSAADGHPTLGSYAFIVGSAAGGFGSAGQAEDVRILDYTPVIIRWFNLISLSLVVGSLGFRMFVWTPAVAESQPTIERRMSLLTWGGWVMAGIIGFLLIFLQYSAATDNPILANINSRSLEQLIADTRFGHLWLSRMALWVGMGLSLWFARTDKWFNPVALTLGMGMLLTNSLFSHANAAQDLIASVGADWLHLSATAFWIGGLLQFGNVIGPVRRAFNPSAPVLSRLVGYFTNFARVSVAALIVTGLYAAWLEVGSIEGLLTTLYGQVLVIKILLIVPVIGLAAINLFFTHRNLAAGKEIWGKWLRGLVGAEIALTIGVLAAVGALTSIAPARTTLVLRSSIPIPPEPTPITETLSANDLNAQLTISPGWVGENTFTLTVTDSSGAPVTDPTLIRMKFESETQNLGESELRPTDQGNGVYTVTGANLSVAGDWRIRTTIQRPNQYDTLVDFKPVVEAAPSPIIPTPIDPTAPLPNRTLALLAAGIGALIIGGFFLGENRFQPPRASSLLAAGLLLSGVMLMLTGVATTPGTVSASAMYVPEANAPVKLAVTSNQQNPLPYLITENGDLLQPGENQKWTRVPLDARARDVYVDQQGMLWASTDSGFYEYRDAAWSKLSDLPGDRTVLTHGYFFALEKDGITRVPAGNGDLEQPRELKVPVGGQTASDMVMLGNHSHILAIDGQVFHTFDLGLSWKAIDAPLPVGAIGTDADGNLLAVSEDGVRTWNYASETWGPPLWMPGLPSQNINPVLRVFEGKQYAIISGQLYRRAPKGWEVITLPNSDDSYLTGLEFQYPTTLWALDAKGKRLWTTTDAENWTMILVTINSN